MQALLSVYSGYFGDGVSLMMLAFWTMITDLDVKAINGTRILVVTLTNITAVACFVIARAVSWPATLTVLVGAIAGGYAGAHLGQRLPVQVVRWTVIAVTTITTIIFFIRGYF
jgi:uncharacterized membrane protein YfcA